MSIDWLKSSNEERRRLYKVMRAIEDATRLSPLDQLTAALGRPVSLAHGYRSNFSKGGMRRTWAVAIHPWIAEHYRETAVEIDADLFPDPNISIAEQRARWLDANAIRGKLTLHHPSKERGLIEFVDQIPEPDATLKLGEPFCFAFESDTEAPAALYQVLEGQWHAIPLAPDGRKGPRRSGRASRSCRRTRTANPDTSPSAATQDRISSFYALAPSRVCAIWRPSFDLTLQRPRSKTSNSTCSALRLAARDRSPSPLATAMKTLNSSPEECSADREQRGYDH